MDNIKIHSGLTNKGVNGGIKPDILEEYGNNYFELWTSDLSLEQDIKLAGILKELPDLNMTANWITGPGKGMIDTIQKMLNSDTMEMILAYSGSDRSWNTMDEQTDRTYDGTDYLGFTLNIRCYTNEKTGSWQFTTWQTWLKTLALFATPSIANKVNVQNMANNVANGVVKGLANITDVFSKTIKAFTKSDEGIIDSLASSLQTAGNVISEQVSQRDNENRVESQANQETYYGSKLWKLRIFPGIFKSPLPVYIESWSATFSKERYIISDIKSSINDNLLKTTSLPYYVDLTINCKCDQIPSCNTLFSKYLQNG